MKGLIFHNRIRAFLIVSELLLMKDTLNAERIKMGHKEMIEETFRLCFENEIVTGWADEYETYLPS
jgi:hypothetical protein